MVRIGGNILFIHNSTGSRLYRILPQAKYMGSVGWDVKVRGLRNGKTGGVSSDLLEWADLVVVEMVYSPDFIKACRKAGCKIVYEIDDLMQWVPKEHYAYKEMNWWRTFLTFYCLTKVDAIVVTNEKLKEAYKWFNSNIVVFSNYIDLEYWAKETYKNTGKKIRLGWAGGNSHKEDLEFIAPVLKNILKKYPNVKFVATGFGGKESDDPWTKYNYGSSPFKDLPQDQYEYSLGAPMEVFSSKLATMRYDIGIAPVVQNKFSECKTPCKALEYGINWVPGVYSEFLYKDAVIDGVTGYLAKEDPKEWEEKISLLIENKEREKMGLSAFQYVVDKFSFNQHGHKWHELYDKVLKNGME